MVEFRFLFKTFFVLRKGNWFGFTFEAQRARTTLLHFLISLNVG